MNFTVVRKRSHKSKNEMIRRSLRGIHSSSVLFSSLDDLLDAYGFFRAADLPNPVSIRFFGKFAALLPQRLFVCALIAARFTPAATTARAGCGRRARRWWRATNGLGIAVSWAAASTSAPGLRAVGQLFLQQCPRLLNLRRADAPATGGGTTRSADSVGRRRGESRRARALGEVRTGATAPRETDATA